MTSIIKISLFPDPIRKLVDEGNYEQALTMLNNYYDSPTTEEKVKTRIFKSEIYILLGEFQQALQLSNEAMDLLNQEKAILLGVYYAKSQALLRMSEFDAISQIDEKVNSLIDKLEFSNDLKSWYSRYLRIKAIKLSNKGNYKNALDLSQKSYQLASEVSDKHFIPQILGNIGVYYYKMGDVDLSLSFHQQSLSLLRNQGHSNDYHVSSMLNNIGLLYLSKNQLDKALDYFKRSIDLKKEIGNPRTTMISLHNLARTYLLLDEKKKADKVLNQMSDLRIEGNPHTHLVYNVTRAMILKNRKRIKDKAEAQNLLYEIINNDPIDYQFTELAIYNLTELLMDELHKYGDTTILNEIDELLSQLQNIGKAQNSMSIVANSYLIESRLELFRGNSKKAEILLNQGISICQNKGMEHLAAAISEELDRIVEHRDYWNDTDQKSISSIVEKSGIKQITTKIVNNQIFNQEIKEDEPVLFLISTSSGLPVYVRELSPTDTKEINKNLLSNLLSALDMFAQETFNQMTSIDRIQFDDYNILSKRIDDVLILYAFRGGSYSAKKKLDQIVTKIEINPKLNSLINDNRPENNMELKKKIDKLVKSIFINPNSK